MIKLIAKKGSELEQTLKEMAEQMDKNLADFIQPIYCNFTHVTTEMDRVKIYTYEPVIEE